MQSAAATATRFVRRTTIGEGEYRVNFKQFDCDVLDALASDAASAVTPAMCRIYIRLTRAPSECWEREGVLRFTGCERGGEALTAWGQLRALTGVSNSTLSKALAWMHEQGVIGYDARKNGVGIRIFFNRAVASIRRREGQKNLRLVPTPPDASHTPSGGAPFKEYGSEKDLDSHKYPRGCARGSIQPAAEPPGTPEANSPPPPPRTGQAEPPLRSDPDPSLVAAVTSRIVAELRPVIAAAVRRETDATRQWLLSHGLPKATRVAQRETFDLLRSHGVIARTQRRAGEVGRSREAAGESGDGKAMSAKLASYLADVGGAVCRAATGAENQKNCALSAALDAAGRELSALRKWVISDDRFRLDEVEQGLTAVDDRITTALWEAAAPPEREALLNSARSELQKYSARMEREVYEETLRRHATARLRERRQIPRVGMFYMP